MPRTRLKSDIRTPGLDPEDPGAWRAILDRRVEADSAELLGRLGKHRLDRSIGYEAGKGDGLIALAAGLISARRTQVPRGLIDTHLAGCQGVSSRALVIDGTVTAKEFEEATRLACRPNDLLF